MAFDKILIASDHAGYQLKKQIIEKLPIIIFEDLGTENEESVDYTDFANLVAKRISSNNRLYGILICLFPARPWLQG